MQIYYVDASIGSDTNIGTSETLAFKTIQSAAKKAIAGDIVYVKNGTYTEDVKITSSGDPNNYITYQAFPGHKPVVKGEFHAFDITANYIKIIGFDVTAKIYEAIKAGSFETANHHIQILNNVAHDSGGSGISGIRTDFLTIEGNTTFRNAFTSPFQASGISIYQAQAFNDEPGFHNIIRGNISYANENKVPVSDGTVTDGNGIIIDDFRQTQNGSTVPKYTAQTLIEDNIVFDNGGRGINIFQSDNVVVRNNTSINNLKSSNLQGTLNGELTTFFSSNISFANNTVYAQDNSKKAFTDAYSTGNTWDYNVAYGGTDFVGKDNSNAVLKDNNFITADPLFITAGNGYATDPSKNLSNLPLISLLVSPSSTTENGKVNLTYTFSRTGANTNALTVNYGTILPTAVNTTAGAINSPISNGAITFAAGASTATLTVNPTLPLITLTNSAGSSVAEDGTTNLVYTFSRVGVATSALVVSYNVAGTATFDVDYKSLGATTFNSNTGTIMFAAGSNTATLVLDPIADTIVESNETVAITLANGGQYNVGTPTAMISTINNDDDAAVIAPPPVITPPSTPPVIPPSVITPPSTPPIIPPSGPTPTTINVSAGQQVLEGITSFQNITYTVTLSAPSDQTVTVQYATADGTAKAGLDYVNTKGLLTFPPGVTSQLIRIAIQNDAITESNESFTLNLTLPKNAVIGTGIVNTTITDTLTATTTTVLSTAVENLTLTGTAAINGTGNTANNVIEGNNGDNILSGGAGDDIINGNDGTDTFFESANVNFTVQEGKLTGFGNDVFSNIEKVKLQGGFNNNIFNAAALTNTQAILYGGGGSDTLTGGAANDMLYGEDGNDTLIGGAGNDFLDGGLGNNTLTGGIGVDTFLLHLNRGANRITDFNGDILQVSRTEFGSSLQIGNIGITANMMGTASDRNQRFIFDNAGPDAGRLLFDADGSGAGRAVLIANLNSMALSNTSTISVIA